MGTAPTPEQIEFVARYMEGRKAELARAMGLTRPDCYGSSFVIPHISDEGAFWLKIEFDPTLYANNDQLGHWRYESQGNDFDALIEEGLQALREYGADLFAQSVEPIALAIIKIKHANGEVTDRDLRLEGFAQKAIEAVHDRAAALANEMSDGKPFEVSFVGAGNHETAA